MRAYVSLSLLAALALAAGLGAASAEAAPVLAVEDTIRLASGTLPEYVVTAKRVTLDEILRRVNEGEERRDSLMQDQVFTRVLKVVYRYDEKDSSKKAVTQLDDARRIFKKKPDLFREVPLRHKTPGKNDDVEVDTNEGMGEEVASFAFEPRERANYDFTIQERKWVGGHVVYRIGFVPKSKLDPFPSGEVWIDTNEYVVVREEFWYRDRSPAPLFLESIDRCVVERSRVDGKWWVITRIFGRVKLAGPVVTFANIGKQRVSQTVDFAALYTDWQVNRALPDSIFAGAHP
jgi:hypothetical protein